MIPKYFHFRITPLRNCFTTCKHRIVLQRVLLFLYRKTFRKHFKRYTKMNSWLWIHCRNDIIVYNYIGFSYSKVCYSMHALHCSILNISSTLRFRYFWKAWLIILHYQYILSINKFFIHIIFYCFFTIFFNKTNEIPKIPANLL